MSNFKIPDELIFRLEQKYKNKEISSTVIRDLVSDLFLLILQRCIEYQSIKIANFGKFVIYKVFSGKTNTERIRFSFMKSFKLTNALNNDEYVLNKVPLTIKQSFGNNNIKTCQPKQHIKLANKIAKTKAMTRGRELNQNANQNFENGINIDLEQIKRLEAPLSP